MREEPARINHNALRASACERRGRGGARLWLAKSTHLMQQRFSPCGMLVAVGELQPFTFHLAQNSRDPGSRVRMAFRRLSEALPRHSRTLGGIHRSSLLDPTAAQGKRAAEIARHF